MTPEDKQLQEAHQNAMEGINAFNKEMKDAIHAIKDYTGVADE